MSTDPLPPTLQLFLGLLAGLALTGVTLIAAVLHVPLGLTAWLAVFAVVWAAVYLAIKRRLTVLVVSTFLTLGITSMWTQQLFNHPRTPPTTQSTPATIPAD
jgi:hypothetical protein